MAASTTAYTAGDGQLLEAALFTRADGGAVGDRVLHVAPSGGLHARVLVDRGLDLDRAWFAGVPVSWTSASGPRRAGPTPLDDDGWNRAWGGGLVSTCGLRHVGPARGAQPRHGRFRENAASSVRVMADDAHGRVTVTGVVREDDGIGRLLKLERSWTFRAGSGRVDLVDVTTNESAAPVVVPLVYHVNLGHPFLGPLTTVGVLGAPGPATSPMGVPRDVPDELLELDVRASDDDVAGVRVAAGRGGRAVTLRWGAGSLPRAHVWLRRAPGAYVLAVEPANCDVADGGGAPELLPGRSRTTSLSIEVEDV